MPRIRSLKPEFWGHPDPPSFEARLLFMAMWNWADDEGVGTANPKELAGFAFPCDDEIDAKRIRTLLREIYVSFDVRFYTVASRPYYCIDSWSQHQHPNNPSKGRYPKPEEAEQWLYQEKQDTNVDLSESCVRAKPLELVVSKQEPVVSNEELVPSKGEVTSAGGSGGGAKRGKRISADYGPPEELRERLRQKYPMLILGEVLRDFLEFWLAESGSNASKLDWDLTFQRRCRDVAGNPRKFPQFHRTDGQFMSRIQNKAVGWQEEKSPEIQKMELE